MKKGKYINYKLVNTIISQKKKFFGQFIIILLNYDVYTNFNIIV